MDAAEPALRWFPLVARARPPCTPLDTRVARLCSLAESAARTQDQAAASTVHNQAALLASDVGMPALARELCHRHATLYLRDCPLDANAARRALEPLVNLARLHIRDGKGHRAFRLLGTLYQAVTSGTDIIVDDLAVPASTLVTSPDERQELRRWLWSVHLADGTRALTSANRWQEALVHLSRHRGIGNRILDGRQVAVIAHLTAGATEEASSLLGETAAGEPWEQAVTACLTVFCRRRACQPITQSTTTLVHCGQGLYLAADLVVFRTRLGLALIDAVGSYETPAVRSAIIDLAQRAASSKDGYAARDILQRGRLLPERQARQLHELLELSGLDQGSMPPDLQARLNTAVATAESALIESQARAANHDSRPAVSIGADSRHATTRPRACGADSTTPP